MQDFASFSFDFSNEIETESDSTLQPKINLVKKLLAQPQVLSDEEQAIDMLKGYIDESILALLIQIDYEIWDESSASIDCLITQITQNIRQVELSNKTQILLNIPTTFDEKAFKDFLKQINIDLGELGRYISADFKQHYFCHQDNYLSVVNYWGQRIQLGQQDLLELKLADFHNDCNGLISELFIGSPAWPWNYLSLTVQHQRNGKEYREAKQAQIIVLPYQSMDNLSDLLTLVKDNLCSDTYIVLWVREQFNTEQEDLMMKVLDSHASKFGGLSIFQNNLKKLYGNNLWDWLKTQNHFLIDHSAEKLKYLLIHLKAKLQKKLEQLQSEIQLYSQICLNDEAFSNSEKTLAQEALKELRTNFQTSKTLIEQFAVNVDEVSHLLEKVLPEVDFTNAEQMQVFEYQKAQMMLESGFYTEAFQHFQILYHQGMGVIQDIILILANHFEELKNVSLEERFTWIQSATKHSPDNSYFHNLLGLCYEQGLGCMQDFVLAFKEYQLASKHDSEYALNKLGEFYLRGQGIDVNEEQAFECFKKASEKNSDAKFNLGRCYLWGWGTDQNERQGFNYLKEAAEQGSVSAQYAVGWCYLYGRGTSINDSMAIEWLLKAAEFNNSDSQNSLGDCFLNGWGVTQNDDQAFKYYLKAAEQNHAVAQYSVGWCYLNSRGVDWNDLEAYQWLKKSAEQKYADAEKILGDCYLNGWGVNEDSRKAFSWYMKATEQKHAAAQNSVGWCYLNGRGIKEDETKAYHWFKKSAEKNDSDGQNWLGKCFRYGWGVDKNIYEAFQWFKKSAENNNADGQYSLAESYQYGLGITQNKEKAFYWFQKSAENNNSNAQNFLGHCYFNGDGVPQDKAQAFKWFEKSAQQNHAHAQNVLGDFYYFGWVISQNEVEALNWFMKGANQGLDEAQYNVGWCYYTGRGVGKDLKEAKKWLLLAANQGHEEAKKLLQDL